MNNNHQIQNTSLSEIVRVKYDIRVIFTRLTPGGVFWCGCGDSGPKIKNTRMVETSLALTQSLVIKIYSSELPAGRGFHVTAATWLQLSRADFIKKLVSQLLSNDSLSMCHCRRLSRSCRNYDLNLPPTKKKKKTLLYLKDR